MSFQKKGGGDLKKISHIHLAYSIYYFNLLENLVIKVIIYSAN
jgi:hypothetical protein